MMASLSRDGAIAMNLLTTRHALPYLAEAQAQKHVTVNEGLRRLDALIHVAVKSDSVTDEPQDAEDGDAYLLPEGAGGGSWSGLAAGTLAVLQDGAWEAYRPVIGMVVFVMSTARLQVFTEAGWLGLDTPKALGVNTMPDETNRLSAKSDNIFFSHDDQTPGSGDMRLVLNRAGTSNTASLVFQSGFEGRAEMGLSGSDDFVLKIADDQGTFREAIRIDRTTGAVSFPNTP
jgi:hypothetical protein